jgi:hypothetical protein
MNEYVQLDVTPDSHILTKINKEIPYEFKDFKIDLEFDVNRAKELKENFHQITEDEKRRFNALNRHILTKRWF